MGAAPPPHTRGAISLEWPLSAAHLGLRFFVCSGLFDSFCAVTPLAPSGALPMRFFFVSGLCDSFYAVTPLPPPGVLPMRFCFCSGFCDPFCGAALRVE